MTNIIRQHIRQLRKEIRNIKRRKGYKDSILNITKVYCLEREVNTLKGYLKLAY
jgi:hypothetical protein